jgi:hypothetical protein
VILTHCRIRFIILFSILTIRIAVVVVVVVDDDDDDDEFCL